MTSAVNRGGRETNQTKIFYNEPPTMHPLITILNIQEKDEKKNKKKKDKKKKVKDEDKDKDKDKVGFV